jgi:ribulose-5-phosphate 4-epimerase/fuculose-1-phosphate aldolase
MSSSRTGTTGERGDARGMGIGVEECGPRAGRYVRIFARAACTVQHLSGGDRLVAHLGDKSYLMLRNHGLLTAGSSPADAFLYMYIFESACAIQVRAQSGGQELIRIPEPILGGIRAAASQVTRGLGSSLAWPGSKARSRTSRSFMVSPQCRY